MSFSWSNPLSDQPPEELRRENAKPVYIRALVFQKGFEETSMRRAAVAAGRGSSAIDRLVLFLDGGRAAVRRAAARRDPWLPLVTGYATADAIGQAFGRGAYDYVTKDRIEIMGPLLKMKVRRAVELVATERAASRTPDERDHHIRQLWLGLAQEKNAQKILFALDPHV